MSNTAVVTPFAAAAGTCAIAADAVAWLCTETELDRQADADLASRRWDDRQSELRALAVRPPDIEAFLGTARRNGFDVQIAGPEYRLTTASGARLVARSVSDGTLELITRHSRAQQQLIRAHVTDRLVEALAAKDLLPRLERRQDGEVRIRTSKASKPKVDIAVHSNGEATLDVSCVAGNACETLVRDIAHSAGLSVAQLHVKPDYFAKPGEPRRVMKV